MTLTNETSTGNAAEAMRDRRQAEGQRTEGRAGEEKEQQEGDALGTERLWLGESVNTNPLAGN